MNATPIGIDPNAEYMKITAEDIEESTQRAREALEKIICKKIKSTQPAKISTLTQATYLEYPTLSTAEAAAAKEQPKIIKIVESKIDPMEPPKFKAKKIAHGPASLPAPVLHSPPRKVSAAEQAAWKIPPSVSNWKNPKGFTISLEKRMISDGKALQQVSISENFAKLSEALYVADAAAREELEKRSLLQRRHAEREQQERDQEMQRLAAAARHDRERGARRSEEEASRDVIRRKLAEQKREISFVKPTTLEPSASASTALLYDARLFNKNAGISSGFADDEEYALFDRPLFAGSSRGAVAAAAYRPTTSSSEAACNEPGIAPSTARRGPVEFEREADPFGLDSFLGEAKKGGSGKK